VPSYATIADMQARFPEAELIQLTDDERSGALNQGRVTRALEQADNEVDGYVSRYYKRLDAALPVPGLLTDLACDIGRYYLFRNGSPTEQVQKRYDQAIAKLRDIAKGIIKLDQGEETLPEREGLILIDGGEPVASRAQLQGFI
jgi:phage gp36-like protein